ncbi:MAG: hypothetical protein Q9M27_03200 [Mariprofundaceae bacterium]|nr:hypothetical protein [Mariprofundaceae bacterium]
MRRSWMTLFFLVLVACSAAPQHEDEASAMVNNLYTALQQQHWNQALGMYGKKFYESHPREEWLKELKSVQQKLGPMQGRTLVFKRKDPRFHYDVYMFSYRVKYTKGESTDILTLFQDVSGGKLTLVGHKIKMHGGA